MVVITENPIKQRPTELEQLKADALAWCQEHNPNLHELPKGARSQSNACPIAKALGGYVGHTWRPGPRYEGIDVLPQRVQDFISAFDQSKYPELIEKGD